MVEGFWPNESLDALGLCPIQAKIRQTKLPGSIDQSQAASDEFQRCQCEKTPGPSQPRVERPGLRVATLRCGNPARPGTHRMIRARARDYHRGVKNRPQDSREKI